MRGVIDAEDYAEKIVPAIEAALARHEKIKILYRIGPEFESFTAGALWSDTRLGTANLTRFSKVALVTDIPWMRGAVRVFAPHRARPRCGSSRDKELDAAKAWIAAEEAKDAGGEG